MKWWWSIDRNQLDATMMARARLNHQSIRRELMNKINMNRISKRNSHKKKDRSKITILTSKKIHIIIISINCLISTKQDKKSKWKLTKELPFNSVHWLKIFHNKFSINILESILLSTQSIDSFYLFSNSTYVTIILLSLLQRLISKTNKHAIRIQYW